MLLYWILFSDDKDAEVSKVILQELENIDDDTDKVGMPFVRIDDDTVAKEFGILDELPILVYFENKIPSVYEGNFLVLIYWCIYIFQIKSFCAFWACCLSEKEKVIEFLTRM